MEFIEYTIKDLALTIRTGKTPPSEKAEYFNDEINWITPTDLDGRKVIESTTRKLSNIAITDKHVFLHQKETVIIGTKGDIGKVAYIEKPAASNDQTTGVLVDRNKILPELFYYWIKLNKNVLSNKANKSVISILNNKLLRKINVKFPKELKDQQNFVSYLNNIQRTIDLRIESISIIEKIKQAAFLELFLENVDSKKWKYVSLRESEAVISSMYGLATKSNIDKNGYSMVRMNNLTYIGNIDLTELKNVEISEEDFQRYEIKNRNILFNRTNSPDLVGKTAVWNNGPGYVFAGYLIRLELDESILRPYFFNSYFNSEFGKKVLKNKARLSGNLANISATTLLKQKILIPPGDLQIKHEQLYIQLESLKDCLHLSLNYLETIFRSTLQSAFIENVQIDENLFFEDLVANLSLNEIKEKKRLNILIDWMNKNQSRFTSFEKYDEAYKIVLKLLEENSLEQTLVDKNIVLKIKR
ncbi:restriction endonuclease subunit S [Pedobacter foliorum]|uniref:restriction endonuclease subunit S n=1 Tax=Pedobacter foliorum TaxID=2739058 RepID=UPI0015645B1E|nr:restriction endonuclease subunit S [Pedobacter foliorum]NRF40221.1 restriction endonuclease subunit S [Pedobacter foliorum]